MRRFLSLLVLAPVIAASAVAAPEPLSVRIVKPLGGQTSDRVVTIAGSLAGYRGERMTLVVNGIPMSVAVQNGRFEQPQVLSPGLNSIRAVATQEGVTAEDQVALFARVPAKDLRVTLTWTTPATDVDLWVTGPDGERVMYSNRQGKAGGVLDTDVTTGFGPETYTQARVSKGTYKVEANAFSITRPTRVEVTTVLHEGTPDEERHVFRAVLLKTKDTVVVGEFLGR